MKLLIIGGSSFIGGNLEVRCRNKFDTYVTYNSNDIEDKAIENKIELDITNKKDVGNVIKKIRPDAIIHLAAISKADVCIKNKDLAWDVNVESTANIAKIASELNIRLIFASTDLIYDGNNQYYSENDEAKPICYYGQTKLEAEKIIKSYCTNYSIVRISLVYGTSRNSSSCFAVDMVENFRNKNKVGLFTDEYRSPIYIEDLCDVFIELVKRNDLQGIYNAGGPERISRVSFGEKMTEIYNFDKSLINKALSDDFQFVDKRPKDCSVDISKLKNILSWDISDVNQGLKRMFSEI